MQEKCDTETWNTTYYGSNINTLFKLFTNGQRVISLFITFYSEIGDNMIIFRCRAAETRGGAGGPLSPSKFLRFNKMVARLSPQADCRNSFCSRHSL